MTLAAAPEPRVFEQVDLLALHEALTRLEGLDARLAEIVTLRFFGGLTVDEVAEVVQLSSRSVAKEWRAARAWLRRELQGFTEEEPG